MKFELHKFLTAEEEKLSVTLTTLQMHGIHNLIVDCVNEKISMSAEVEGYLMKQEYLRGQMSALQYMLAIDSSVKSSQNS